MRRVMWIAVFLLPGGASMAQSVEPVARTEQFAFFSDPWIQLHHFLYQWSRADLGLGEGRAAVSVPERNEIDRLSSRDREVWERTLTLYRAAVAERGHFDDAMLELKQGLVDLRGDRAATPPDDIPGVAAALRDAMPVYVSSWWPGHDALARAWIADVAERARAHEAAFARIVERSFGGRWPEDPVRVDASAYGNWQGGYTSVRPTHVVVVASDPRNQAEYGLELLLHESLHDSGVQGPSRRAIAAAHEARQDRPHPNLWHGLIFYTAGWYVRHVVRDAGGPEHVPYMVREGIDGFTGWTGIWDALEAEWPPVLEGRRDREEALAAVVDRLRQAGGSR